MWLVYNNAIQYVISCDAVFWDADSQTAGHTIPHTSWKLKFCKSIKSNWPLVHILRQINPHTATPYISNFQFNVITLPTPWDLSLFHTV